MRPLPKGKNWKQYSSTSSASALATWYEFSMAAWHCQDAERGQLRAESSKEDSRSKKVKGLGDDERWSQPNSFRTHK